MEAVLEKKIKKKKKPRILDVTPNIAESSSIDKTLNKSEANVESIKTVSELIQTKNESNSSDKIITETPNIKTIDRNEGAEEEKLQKDFEPESLNTKEITANELPISSSPIQEQCIVINEPKELVKSSAPIAENITEVKTLDRYLQINKQILQTIECIDSIPAQIATNNMKTSSYDGVEILDLKPYTEQQLNAFYHNSELEIMDEFNVNFIEAELKGVAIKQHPFYELVTNYLIAREKNIGNNLELKQLRNEYNDLQNEIWTIESVTVTSRGQCEDLNIVCASHTYDKSIFHRSVFQNIVRILGNIRKLVYENHVLYSYSATDLKLQIDLYVQSVIQNTTNATKITNQTPVALLMQEQPQHLRPYLNELRLCISILFAFQRKLIRDVQFLKETRQWLTQLVAVLLRIANYQDHLFLVNHILRSPAGVGNWATSFIQLPLNIHSTESPFANTEINHLLTILGIILCPIKERETFLKEMAQNQDTDTEALWVIVDSDGEEDDEGAGTSLKENDLVALFNQLPLDDLFRCVFLIKRRDQQDYYDGDLFNEHHLLKFFAFSTALLRLIYTGLQTYAQPKYNQFSKRLSRFIRQIVQYATDHWEQFLKTQNVPDKAMLQRLQCEYDALFLRAVYYLYSSQKLGAWQFLSVFPFSIITIQTLWKIFYLLHTSDAHISTVILNTLPEENVDKQIWENAFREQFDENLEKLEAAEVYYLLNTFANMALDRKDDIKFIHTVTLDLLQIGFITKFTQDSCSKSVRILLTQLTSKYPHFLSDILKIIKINMDKIGSLVLYLYEEIPLSIWIPTDADFDIIAGMLLNNQVGTDGSKLARMILSRLNWDLIPYEKHCDTAVLVVKAVDQEPEYLQWAWQTILRLKLHISDKHFNELGQVEEIERHDILLKGTREDQPLAGFVAILMTSWGHLVPLIITKGLAQILLLQSHQKHEPVLFALYQITPLFIQCQECLINCDKYQQVLINLLNADRGYISYAKSFVVTQNTVLQQLGNMIECQIVNYEYYNLDSPRLLIRFWVNSLVSVPNWYKDNAVLYLTNILTKLAYLHPESIEVIYYTMNVLYEYSTPSDSNSIINIFKWGSQNSNSSGILFSTFVTYPWLTFAFLEMEQNIREGSHALWQEILLQLYKQTGKINVDNAIKKATSVLHLPVFNSSWLCIYRWPQLALETPMDHPLLPLIWQKFFVLFLDKISSNNVCVGEKFFDGIINFGFLKRIKKRLQDTIIFYKDKCDINDDDYKDIKQKEHYKGLFKLYQAFLLWLEEPRLRNGNILLENLPSQYESKLLARVLNKDLEPWFQFMDYQMIKTNQELGLKAWRTANFREKTRVNLPLPVVIKETPNPIERILGRLNSYDTPIGPPQIKHRAPLIPPINFTSKESMFESLKQSFRLLEQFADNHIKRLSEHKTLDLTYQDIIPELYRSVLNKVTKKVPCRGKNQTVQCSGPAKIQFEVQEARIDDKINHQVVTNRTTYDSLLEKSLDTCATNLMISSLTIQQCVKLLEVQLKRNLAPAELGVELFYYILSLQNEKFLTYLPTKTLFNNCIQKLGQTHICGVEQEMPRLLTEIFRDPKLVNILAQHFSLENVSTSNMLIMYETIIDEMRQKIEVCFPLLSKFDVEKWLNDKNPKLSHRSQLIKNIIRALCLIGYDPPIQSLTLHGLFKQHLQLVFEFQFPEHYGEVLLHMLKASNGSSDANAIDKSVWIVLLNSLSRPVSINLKSPLRDQLRQYAQHQRVLNYQDFLDTSNLLARHFTEERLRYGLYGLYPKCRNYMDVYMMLLGMIGHGLIITSLNTHQGLLGDKLCEKIWPYLREMFAPWLIPYSLQTLKDTMPDWIQRLADDRSVLMPWIPSDLPYAQKIMDVFFECITFVLQTLPGSTSILSYLWQWYVMSFANLCVKNHILININKSLTAIPWQNFWPSLIDLDFMLRVVDQYLPDCHSFLGHVFVYVSWTNWFNNFTNAPQQIKSKIYHCFLNLIVKLSNEPNIKQNYLDKIRTLLVQAENFDWIIIESNNYQHIMDWVVMSFDSGIIFKCDPLDLDYRLFSFLKIVSGYHKPWTNYTANLFTKRLTYVKANIKLLSVYVSRNKKILSSKQHDVYEMILGNLTNLETVVTTEEEMLILQKELNKILNIQEISIVAFSAFVKWIQNSSNSELITKSLLKTLGVTVTNCQFIAELYELVLTNYFTNLTNLDNIDDDEPSWIEASNLINIVTSKPGEIEDSLITKGSVLTLNALLLQRVRKGINKEILLLNCIDWLGNIKISDAVETKLPLIWSIMLNLALDHYREDAPGTVIILNKFSHILLQLAEDKTANKLWGRSLLNAIGLTKQEAITLKFICRALAGCILGQLPETRGQPGVIRTTSNAPSIVGQPGGNTECPKVLLTLDFGQSQGKIKEMAEFALTWIQDPANSLHNATTFLSRLVKQFYMKPYLKDFG